MDFLKVAMYVSYYCCYGFVGMCSYSTNVIAYFSLQIMQTRYTFKTTTGNCKLDLKFNKLK